ncbi:ribbon-helix-helix domain-containing protein [Candidatus Woesearchaeota archaeon]|nr:ribbon-helix-helix domain-containing protein [Candidatus Woesearchaeota archaeon]
MKYTNVPLPTPVIARIDEIISNHKHGYRSRPDFILHHIRIALDKLKGEESAKQDPVSEVWER